MFGHSLGNATAASAMVAGVPITAGANLDGSLIVLPTGCASRSS
jgi:hypothetical protein